MENEQKIYLALCNINKEVKAVGKDHKNKDQGFQYRSIDDVANELHDLFAKHEVLIIPEVLDHTREERKSAKGNALFYTWLKVKFRLITTDGSFVEPIGIGEAMDMSDKGTNKAQAFALKYALTQMFLIPTSDTKEADAESHEVKPKDKAVAEKPAQKEKELPTVTDKFISNAIDRILAGEPELWDKIKANYKLSQQQIIELTRAVDEYLNIT